MTESTPRLGLPLLVVGQAEKEGTHNEALIVADALVQSVVQAVAPAAIPATPVAGQCWIVGNSAGGAWQGHDNAVAIWTEGGWRFVPSFEGMHAWSLADSQPARRSGAGWTLGRIDAASLRIAGRQVVGAQQPAIGNASGGTVVDAEARVVLTSLLAALRVHGLIAP